ncbi:MAG: hypothetical protein R2874_04925 [Desulfobacterales bacterium]
MAIIRQSKKYLLENISLSAILKTNEKTNDKAFFKMGSQTENSKA